MRFLLLVLGAFVVFPLVLGYALTSPIRSKMSEMASVHNSVLSEPERSLRETTVASGGTSARAVADYDRLVRNAATPEQARRATSALHVAVVEWAPSEPPGKAPPAELHVDLTDAARAAVLVLLDGPAQLSIAPPRDHAAGKLAVEGFSAFAMRNAPPGALGGFRIRDFGVANAATAKDFTAPPGDHKRGRLCEAIMAWADFYQVEFDAVRIWRTAKLQSIKATDAGVGFGASPPGGATLARGMCVE